MDEINILESDFGSDLENVTEGVLEQYLSVMVDYVVSLAQTFQSDKENTFLNNLSTEDRDLIHTQLGHLLEFSVEWELWDLYDYVIICLEYLKK